MSYEENKELRDLLKIDFPESVWYVIFANTGDRRDTYILSKGNGHLPSFDETVYIKDFAEEKGYDMDMIRNHGYPRDTYVYYLKERIPIDLSQK